MNTHAYSRLHIFCTVLLAVVLLTTTIQSAFAATTATLLPTGEGTNLAWTPSTGLTHYTTVDESSCNGTTDYVSETTVGDRDAYTVSLASVPLNATITNIALTPCASRNSSGSGSATLNVFYRYNAVASADAGAYALPTGTTPVALGTTNFGSLSLVKKSTSTLEIGAVYTAGTKGIRLSRMATVLTYTPVSAPVAPSNLSASIVASSTKVFLTWSDNSSNETGFLLARSLDNLSFTTIATTTGAQYLDSAVASGVTYYYKVRAYNAVGNSGYSSTTSATLP